MGNDKTISFVMESTGMGVLPAARRVRELANARRNKHHRREQCRHVGLAK